MEKNYLLRDFKVSDYKKLKDLWDLTGLGGRHRGDDLRTIELSIGLGGKLIVMEILPSMELIGSSWMTFDGRRLHLHHFGIAPKYQGQKLSVPLLRKSLLYAKNKNIQIKLEVHKENRKAINLYLKNKFEYLGDYMVYIIRDIKGIDEFTEEN